VVACGTGFDARLIEATSREAKRRYGVAAYFIAASGLLGHLAPQPTVLTVDGVRSELESVVVLVANCGEAIPGRLRPRLPIDPDDGLLHVFVLPMGGVLGGIRGALELMVSEAGGTSPSGAAMRLKGTEVRVEVMPAGPTQVDGDVFGTAALDAHLLPGGLSVIRP
jgi:diacylglycerol kinase family enzyme